MILHTGVVSPSPSGPIPNRVVPTELQNRTDYMLCKLADAIKRSADEIFSEAGIRGAHHALLRVLHSRGAMPQKDLTDVLRVDQSTVVSLVDQLEAMSLVVRQRNPTDRRAYKLELTDNGRATLALADVLSDRVQSEVFDTLTESEREELRRLVAKLASAQ